MKLTAAEKAICREYSSRRGEDGLEGCYTCPLVIDARMCLCYATIDDDDMEAEWLIRYTDENDTV